MVYCSIEEAWGDDFQESQPRDLGNNNTQLGFQPSQPTDNLIRDTNFQQGGGSMESLGSNLMTEFQRSNAPLEGTHNYGESRDSSLLPFTVDGDDEYQSYGGEHHSFGGGEDTNDSSSIDLRKKTAAISSTLHLHRKEQQQQQMGQQQAGQQQVGQQSGPRNNNTQMVQDLSSTVGQQQSQEESQDGNRYSYQFIYGYSQGYYNINNGNKEATPPKELADNEDFLQGFNLGQNHATNNVPHLYLIDEEPEQDSNNMEDVVRRMDRMLSRFDKNQKQSNPFLDMFMFLVMGALIIVILDLFFRFGQKS